MADANGTGETESPRSTPYLIRALTGIAAFIMFSLMAITFVDVVGRYAFNHPLGAAFEIIELLLGLLIFSALPLVSRNQSHITVSLFEGMFRGRIKWFQQLFVLLFSACAAAFITWRLWAEMQTMRANQDVGEFMDIELWPFIGAVTLLSGVTFAILLWLIVDYLRGKLPEQPTSTHGEPL